MGREDKKMQSEELRARLKKLGKESRQMQTENRLEKRAGVRHFDSEASVKTSITNK